MARQLWMIGALVSGACAADPGAVQPLAAIATADSSAAANRLTDGAIAAEIRDRLAIDPATDADRITVSVSAGRVLLGGSVRSWQQGAVAAAIAGEVPGVVAIDNQVRLLYPARRADHEIALDIARRFELHPRLDPTGVVIAVRDGEVTLAGSVGVGDARRARAAAWVIGVRAIDASGLEAPRAAAPASSHGQARPGSAPGISRR